MNGSAAQHGPRCRFALVRGDIPAIEFEISHACAQAHSTAPKRKFFVLPSVSSNSETEKRRRHPCRFLAQRSKPAAHGNQERHRVNFCTSISLSQCMARKRMMWLAQPNVLTALFFIGKPVTIRFHTKENHEAIQDIQASFWNDRSSQAGLVVAWFLLQLYLGNGKKDVDARSCFAAGLFLLGVVAGITGAGPGFDGLINIATLVTNIIFGLNGNSWREKNLVSRGYEFKNTITAANPEGAVALYLKEANVSF